MESLLIYVASAVNFRLHQHDWSNLDSGPHLCTACPIASFDPSPIYLHKVTFQMCQSNLATSLLSAVSFFATWVLLGSYHQHLKSPACCTGRRPLLEHAGVRGGRGERGRQSQRQLHLGSCVAISLRVFLGAAPRGWEQQLVYLSICRSTLFRSESHSSGSCEVGLPVDITPPS